MLLTSTMLAALAMIILAQPPWEIQRLRAHFAEVDRALRAAPPPADAARQARRSALLDELRAYADAELFPENFGYVYETPFFLDRNDTRCAVAHLLEVTGEEALMRRIATTANTALVPELRDDPELLAWLDEHGLSVADAARIQPSYSYPAHECVCGGYLLDSSSQQILAVYEVAETDGSLRARSRLAGRDLFAVDAEVVGIGDDPISPRAGAGPWIVAIVEHAGTAQEPTPTRTLVALPLSTPCPRYIGFTGPPALGPDLLARAFLASNAQQCDDILIEADPRWAFESNRDGCAIGREDPPPGLLALLLTGWAVGRRRRRRSRRRQR